MPNTYKFFVPGVTCVSCSNSIKNIIKLNSTLNSEPKFEFDMVNKIAAVTVDDAHLSTKEIRDALRSSINELYESEDILDETIPVELEIKTSPSVIPPAIAKKIQQRQKIIYHHIIKGLIGIVTGSVLLGLSISGLAVPLLVMYGIAALSTLATLYFGKETYKDAFASLFKSRTLTMDTLFSMSSLIALGVSFTAFFFPWLPQMYDAALLIFGFRHIGKAVEESVKRKITSSVTFRSLAPRKIATQQASGKFIATFVNWLLPGDIIKVYRGQVIPVDGLCLDDHVSVNAKIRTGQDLPQAINKGDLLYAGMKVADNVDYLTLKVTKTAAKSYLAVLDKNLEQAQGGYGLNKAPLEVFADKVMQYFVPTVFALAVISAIVIGVLFSPASAIQCAAAILVSACPCTFGLITPLAIHVGIAKAAAVGVQFASGKALQAAQEVDTVVFDLNGTLTTGLPRVDSGNLDIPATTMDNATLDYLAALEQGNTHPVAVALCKYIDKRRPEKNLYTANLSKTNHSGVRGSIKGVMYTAGNENMMHDFHLDISRFKKQIAECDVEHVIYLARGHEVLGYILLKDDLRPEAKNVINQLSQMSNKKTVHLCTGADSAIAKKWAKKLGIKHVEANCDPQAKAAYINKLTALGHKVAMVGDGINDAPAIKSSYFGIAIKSNVSDEADKITQEKAGATISPIPSHPESLSLKPIIAAFTIANQTVSNMKQNLIFSLSYNLLSVLLFTSLIVGIGFAVNPALGVALMILQTVFIFANLERLKRKSIPYANDKNMVTAECSTEKRATMESTHQRVKRALPQAPLPANADLVTETESNYKRSYSLSLLAPPPPKPFKKSASTPQLIPRGHF